MGRLKPTRMGLREARLVKQRNQKRISGKILGAKKKNIGLFLHNHTAGSLADEYLHQLIDTGFCDGPSGNIQDFDEREIIRIFWVPLLISKLGFQLFFVVRVSENNVVKYIGIV